MSMNSDKDSKVLNIYQSIFREMSSIESIQCNSLIDRSVSNSYIVWDKMDYISKKTYDHDYCDIDYFSYTNTISDKDAELYKEICKIIFPKYETEFRIKLFESKLEMDFDTILRSLKDETISTILARTDQVIYILTKKDFVLDDYDYRQPELGWVYHRELIKSVSNIYQKIIWINNKHSILIIPTEKFYDDLTEKVGPLFDRFSTWRYDFT